MDTNRVHPESIAGDGIAYAGEARRELSALEDRFAHELMDDEERQELGESILRLRRRVKLGVSSR